MGVVWLLRKCVECGRYALKTDSCPHCGGRLRLPHPARFSPDDKYAKYRRAMREADTRNEGDHHQRENEGRA